MRRRHGNRWARTHSTKGFGRGRIFVGLRKFEAKQDAVFRRPRARPFVEGGVAPRSPISA